MATYVLTIAGTTKTLRIQSLNISETLNGRNLMRFDVISTTGSYRPAIGAEVILTEDGTRIFGGYINAPSEVGLMSADWSGIVTKCSAVDFNSLADRRVVTSLTLASGTLKAALQALDDYLTDYGVTLDSGQVNGPTLPALAFEDRTVRECFDELAALSDYVWEIDYNKTLRMVSPASTSAPFNVVDGDGHAIGDVTVEPTREDYANTVVVLGGTGQREVTDNFTGNGSTAAFTLSYELAVHRGYVTNAGTVETLGSGATWTYSTSGGTTTITRSSAPANGNAIVIIYTAQFPKRVTATTSTPPSAANVVERVLRYPDTFDAAVLDALADTAVARLSADRKIVRYITFEDGIHPGQTQTITIADRNLNSTFLVTDVVITNPSGNLVQRQVTATLGSVFQGSWRDTVRGWSGGGSSVSSVTGTFVLNTSGTVPGDVIANWDKSGGTTDPTEASLRGRVVNATVVGPAVVLGRQRDSAAFAWLADYIAPSPLVRRCVLIPLAESSNERFVLGVSQDRTTPVDGEYYVTGSPVSVLNIGAPDAFYGSSASRVNVYADTLRELGRSYRPGGRNAYSHSAGDFTADTGSWTVGSGDVSGTAKGISWTKVGFRMSVDLMIAETTTSGTPNYLKFTLPASSTIVGNVVVPCLVFHGSTWQVGYIQAVDGETFIRIYSTVTAAAWPNETDTIWIRGSIGLYVTT